MLRFIERHTFLSIIILLAAVLLLWMIFAVWPEWLISAIGRKKTFVITLLNGVTLAGLYFLVASGFTLVFGLMRNVNLAHGSMYLMGGYIGYEVSENSGSWFLGLLVAFIVIAEVVFYFKPLFFDNKIINWHTIFSKYFFKYSFTDGFMM